MLPGYSSATLQGEMAAIMYSSLTRKQQEILMIKNTDEI